MMNSNYSPTLYGRKNSNKKTLKEILEEKVSFASLFMRDYDTPNLPAEGLNSAKNQKIIKEIRSSSEATYNLRK